MASGDAIGSRKMGIDMFATVFTSMSVTSSRFWWVSVRRSMSMRELELGWRSTCALSSWSSMEKHPTVSPLIIPPTCGARADEHPLTTRSRGSRAPKRGRV